MDARQQQLQAWLEEQYQHSVTLNPVVGDASFRRYFRFMHKNNSLVAMDSPPNLEDCKPFVEIAKALQTIGVTTPEIIAANTHEGFLVITDFGDQLFHHALNSSNVDQFYGLAFDDLHKIQSSENLSGVKLEPFDEKFMRKELNFFTEWFLEKYLELKLDAEQETIINTTYDLLLKSAVEQPQVVIHRDYHSRNLMLLNNNQLGVIDFQDAMLGPITYDLVSMIRDCYIDWPKEQVEKWALSFYKVCLSNNRLDNISSEAFVKYFDLMGMQRHLKASFIFARKYLRDKNDFYLQFLPRTLNYIHYVANKYPELEPFAQFFDKIVLSLFKERFNVEIEK